MENTTDRTGPSARKNRLLHHFQCMKKMAAMELTAAQMLVEHQMDLYTRTLWEEPERVVWTNMVMPTELFYACGLIPVHTEMTAGWISSLRLAETYIRLAEEKGFHVNLCSYHKAVIGAMECGDIPPPRLAVFSSHICDGGNGLLQYFRHRFHTAIFLLDVPCEKCERALLLVERQLDALRSFLSEAGHPAEPRAIARAVRYANACRGWLVKANELRKRQVLFYGNQALRNLFGTAFLMGAPQGAAIARAYYRQLEERSRHPESLPRPEMPLRRILWIHFAPLHAGGLMRYLESTLGCVIAFDITGYIYWQPLDESSPMESLAKKIMAHFYLKSSADRLRLYRRLLEEYRAEGIVMLMHQGCRAIPGSSWEIRLLAQSAGLPFLELPGDCIDPRGMPAQQTILRMEAFRESLDIRRPVTAG